MKKISLVALALSAGLFAFAQNQPQLTTHMAVEPRFGIKGGVNIANLNNKDYPSSADFNSNTKTGFHAGFLLNLPMGEVMKFQPELLYSLQGAKSRINISTPTGSFTSNYKTDLHYLNLPLMFQARTPNGGFYVELGPQLSYLIKAKNKDITNSGGGTTTSEVDIKDQLKKFDVAACGGIGFVTRVGLGIDARYNWGFLNVLDKNNSANISGAKLRNRVLQIGLFYQFGAYE